MDKKEIAEALSGSEWPIEIPNKIREELELNNLVALYYASDDLIYLKGCINDVVDIDINGDALFFKNGELIKNSCDEDNCPHFKEKKHHASKIIDTGDYRFITDIPHETFTVFDSGDLFCTGVVFDMKDLSKKHTDKHKVDLALMISKYIHEKCKDVPHDIGMNIVNEIEVFVNRRQ